MISPARATATARLSRRAVVGAVTVLVGSAFQLAMTSITNDDYLHLAMAQQWVLGDPPIKGFVDVGEFLFIGLSAASQQLFGRSLLTEVVLDVSFMAIARALSFWLVCDITGSMAAGVFATFFSVLMIPRFYAYPKIFLYVVAIALLWRYVDVRSTRRLLIVGAFTAIAFLFRHDHGLSIGLAACMTICAVHALEGWRLVARRIAVLGVTAAVALVPYLVFVQMNGGLLHELQVIRETGRVEYARTRGPFPRFGAESVGPRIAVRWREDTPDSERSRAERALGLSGSSRVAETTWTYELRDTSAANIRALVEAPNVADTSGIDRSRYRVTVHAFEPNAAAWLYWLTVLLPMGTLIWLWAAWRDEHTPRHVTLKVAVVALIALVMQPFLLRTASTTATADVSAVTGILGAIVVTRILLSRGDGRWIRYVSLSLAGIVLAGTAAAISRSGGGLLLREWIHPNDGQSSSILKRIEDFRQFSRPITEGERYLSACTRPADHVLIAAYAPDVYYRIRRRFAAGIPYFARGYWRTSEAEALTRLRRQRVPVALSEDPDFDVLDALPELHRHLSDHYREAGEIQFGDTSFTVFTDVRIPVLHRYRESELPCFGF